MPVWSGKMTSSPSMASLRPHTPAGEPRLTAWRLADPLGPPVKPSLRIVEINLIGTIYTAKLAMHYFRRQPVDVKRDRCLIIKGSIAAYADQPGSPQYNISKWGARGLFRNLRRTIWKEGIRVNFVAPW